MKPILPQIGYELATEVKEENRRIVDLADASISVKSKRTSPKPLLDFLLLHLVTPMNSMFFVDHELDFINSYINSLALYLLDTEVVSNKLLQLIDVYDLAAPFPFSERYTYKDFENDVLRNVGKTMYAVDTTKLVSLGKSNEDWDSIVSNLVQETQVSNYFLVMHHIEELFNRANTENHYLARHILFLTRGKARLTFIAPITWADYVNHVENSQLGGLLVKHRRAIFFSPRPSHLLGDINVIYDDDYIYNR